jgi:hypothetical protein
MKFEVNIPEVVKFFNEIHTPNPLCIGDLP